MNIKKLRELKKNKKGFTLIEIIVVVVILAVLMAVAVPSVMKYLSEADNAKYMAQARTVMTTAQAEMAKAYAGDKKIDAEEWAAMIGDTAKAEGTINTAIGDGKNATNIKLYTSAKITQKGDVITVTDQSEITAPSGTTTLSSPDFKVMTFNLDGKGIAIELNGKVYVGDEFE